MKVLKFQASWCQPCKMLTRIMEDASDKITIPVEVIDIDENQDMAVKYAIRGVPTLVIIDGEGKEVSRKSGMMAENRLMEFLSV
jgi:thioredoxin 1